MAVGGESLELTRSQLMIWTGQRLQPDEPLYNMILAFEIQGRIDAELFAQAFQTLVDRCDALRLVIEADQGAPRQRFLDGFDYQVEQVDFSGEPDPDSALGEWIENHRVHNFDLGDCLFESTLLKLGESRHVWYFNQHHIAMDVWSTALLFRRMQDFYALARAGGLGEAPALPAYRDYVLQERVDRDSPAARRAQAYWGHQLKTPLQPSSFYRQPPAERSGRTERRTRGLGAERSARLRAMAEDSPFQAFTSDLGRFQLFATALFAYLFRITGHERLSMGAPTHNRVSPILKQTPGLFIEIFPLQVSLDHDESFLSLHAKVAHATRQLLINTGPGISGFEHNRAYDVLLNYITVEFGDFDGMPANAEWIHSGYGDRNHLLRIQVEDFNRAGEFVLHFDMNLETFVGDEPDRAIRHFFDLLDGLLGAPESRIADVPLLSDRERERLTEGLGPTGSDAGASGTIVDRFEAQAAATPDKTALTCDGTSLSYAELDARADRLAAYLAGRGIGRGARVALCLPRSMDVVAAILGVLKCGAAYVPIDPEYPAERIRFIARDAGVACLLTLTALREQILATGVEILSLDQAIGQAGPSRAETRPAAPRPQDTSYVIYTSGSTGRPKGVVVNHAGLANYIDWAERYYLQGQALDFPLFSTLAFDLTVTSLFLPLVCGGRLVIYPESTDGREITIQRVVEDNQVDIIKLTPAHLALIQTLDLSSSRIRKLIVGGEDLKTNLVRAIARRFGGEVDIYNEYGPTEGTVACMVHRCDPERDDEASVPIGHPIDNARIYLLDAHRNPVPTGVIGEIHIGGAGLADGYLNADELTRQRFPDNPFAGGGRLYATGDLGRWGDDGVMRYLGRGDHQVKIRGVRVELGEIEAALLDHDGISACVVNAVERADPARDSGDEPFCTVCGLSGRHPDARLDEQGVCRICRAYEQEPDKAHGYFGTMDDLRSLVQRARAEKTGEYDSLALLSGGKDSSYALCRLVEMGLRPLVFTLDNGFISDGAKANIRRLTDSLGLDLHVGTTPAMNAIFVDSLNRHSNVCNGCFKTIYTLSMNLAHELGIRYITTGLSRGQIFETRLADMFRHRIFDPERIDHMIVEARKAYHRQDDAVSQHMDTAIFQQDAVFEDIQFVDFYRYCDVGLDEIYAYLDAQAGWIRPADTGRSTNCLINEAGIFVHKTEKGFHNYSLPYSWDVRLGHKERDAAREELDDHIDVANVRRILGQIGYQGEATAPVVVQDKRLLAYYVAESEIPSQELQAALALRLPQELLPKRYLRLPKLPLTHNGKVDRDALPPIEESTGASAQGYSAPVGDMETRLAVIWAEVIGLERVGRHDNFFDLGGDSILNIQIVGRAKQAGLAVTPQQIFDFPTVAELAAAVGHIESVTAEQGIVEGDSPLTPIQRRFFEARRPEPQYYNQAVLAEVPQHIHADTLRNALRLLLRHHDGLRSRFTRRDGEWRQFIPGIGDGADQVPFECIDTKGIAASDMAGNVERVAEDLHAGLNLEIGPLVRAAFFPGRDGPGRLLIVAHHLVTDGVSWWILLEDLQTLCRQSGTDEAPALPAKTTSIPAWAHALDEYAQSRALRNELDFWAGSASVKNALPLDAPDTSGNDLSSARTHSVQLSPEETSRLLHQVPSAYNTQVSDVLLTALALCCNAWSGHQDLYLDVEGHGREEVVPGTDLLRTVGWFTSVYPVRLQCAPQQDPGQALMSVKEQLRAVPNRGIGYGALRYLCRETQASERLRGLPARELLFNYLGQWERGKGATKEIRLSRPIMLRQPPRGRRPYLFEVDAVVFSGRLRVDWTYSAKLHDTATVEALADAFIGALRSLISHCLSAEQGGLTPSDFPQADLDQDGLNDLLAEFGQE